MIIYKTNNKMRGERVTVKRFQTPDAGYKFMYGKNIGHPTDWKEASEDSIWSPKKPGTYAYAGQAWHNVKSLPISVLSHI